jgi:hypothetical protein
VWGDIVAYEATSKPSKNHQSVTQTVTPSNTMSPQVTLTVTLCTGYIALHNATTRTVTGFVKVGTDGAISMTTHTNNTGNTDMTKAQRQRLLDTAAKQSNLYFEAAKKAMKDSYYDVEHREQLHRLDAMEQLLDSIGITLEDIQGRAIDLRIDELKSE